MKDMALPSRFSRAITGVAFVGATVLTGCGVSPAYGPVRTPVAVADLPPDAPPPPPATTEPAVGYEDTDPAALTDFHEALSPYGAWEDDATYGTVWVPAAERVGAGFAPYKTAGHWELDESEQWLWVSDHDDTFGWVVFHYGRWAYTDARGWVWIPGRRYAPAWVAWQAGDPGYGYVGWAPMPPTYYWRSSSLVWLDVYPYPAFIYCPTAYVFYHDWHTHAVPHTHVVAVATPMHPYGVPRGSGHVYADPHRGPTLASGVVPRGSFPTSRHRLGEGPSRYATPGGAGGGLGGSARPGSRSRSASFDGPGEARASRSLGVTEPPGARARAADPSRLDTRPSAGGAFGPPRSAAPGASTRLAGPPSADGPVRAPSHVAPHMMPSPSAPSGPIPFSRPSAPPAFPPSSAPSTQARPPTSSFSTPSRPSSFSAPSHPSSFSAPSHPSSFSGPSHPSSFSAPSRPSSASPSVARPSSGGFRGRR